MSTIRFKLGVHPFALRAKSRGWIVLPCIVLSLVTSCLYPDALEPTPGLYDFRVPLRVGVPGGQVDAAGGNLVVRRVDFSIDTRLGTREVGATYNSISRRWIWSFHLTYDGTTFTDTSGAVHDVSQLADGQAIPGTHWRKVDERRIRTKGGLVHHFGPFSDRLTQISLGDAQYPFLAFVAGATARGQRVVAVNQCVEAGCTNVYTIHYDDKGCVSALVDRSGRSALFDSGVDCNPLSARDPLDVVKGWPGHQYEYDSGQLTSVTDSEGVRFEYSYLGGHLMTAYAPQASGAMMTFSYGFAGPSGLHFTRMTDSRGGTSLLHYDAQGRLHSFLDPAGDFVRFEWSGLRPVAMTDPAGELTTWEYVDDDPVRIRRPDGNVVEIEYEPRAINPGRPFATAAASVRDSVGPVVSRAFDPVGRLSWLYVGTEQTSLYGYTSSGEVSSVSDSTGRSIYLSEYGEHGYPELFIRDGIHFRRRFDAVGNLLSGPEFAEALDPSRPGIVSRTFDADRNLVAVEVEGATDAEPLGAERSRIEIEYRSNGRPIRISRPYGGDTRFDYDAAGQQVARSERVDGIWQSIRYEYSAGGRLSSTEWPNGMRQEVDHDSIGRPVAVRLLRDGVLEKSLTSTWEAGRLVARVDSERSGVERFFFDPVGRVNAIHFPEGEILEFAHDMRGREVERVYRLSAEAPPLRTVSFAYDLQDRLVEWRDQADVILERSYESGRLVKEVTGNGLVRTLDYDETSGLLHWVFTTGSSETSLYVQTEHLWQQCGAFEVCISLLSMVEPGSGASLPDLFPEEGYRLGPLVTVDDGLDYSGARLMSWGTYALSPGPYSGDGEYGFDTLGNWLGTWQGDDEISRLFYNAERNRLLAADLPENYTYTWDEAGFLLSRNQETIEWDAGGRPTAFGTDRELEWDTLGRLVSVRVGEQVSRSLFGGLVRGDMDRNPLSLDLGVVKIDLNIGKRFYRHSDIRGNVQFVSDDEGRMLRYYQYAPFGVYRAWGDGMDSVNFARGQEAGDYLWLGARLYDPKIGRFLSPDPKYQLTNQFSYTLGNPFFFWDPNGFHEVPSPASSFAKIGMDSAAAAQNMGYLAFAAGLGLKSPPLAFGGIGIVGAALIVQWSIEIGCECIPVVEIEDLDGPDQNDSRSGPIPSSGPGVGMGLSPSCAPQVLQRDSRGLHGGVLWLPLQVLLATIFLRSRRGRSRDG